MKYPRKCLKKNSIYGCIYTRRQWKKKNCLVVVAESIEDEDKGS
jgi:hypothetical protein